MRTNIFLILLTVVFIQACTEGDQLEIKKTQLAELKAQLATTKEAIDKLEKEIAKLDKNVKPIAMVKDVQVQTIQPSNFQHYLEIQGKIDSDKNVIIAAKSGGTINKIYVENGQFVRSGTLLAKIESDGFESAMKELEIGLSLANTAFEKQKSLWEQKVGTEMQYLQAKAQKESLEKRKEQLQIQIDVTEIRATIDGTVDEIFPKEGELTGPGMPVMRLINTNVLKVKADVAEAYSGKLKVGNKVILYFPDVNSTREANITSIGDVISQLGRTFSIETGIPGSTSGLKANMISYLKINDYNVSNAIVIPINVIQYGDQGTYVYINENNKAKKVLVKVGKTYKSQAEIIEGLKPGDQLITIGYQDMVDGLSVKI